MKSRLVEFSRFGKLDKGILREGDFYLISQGELPVHPFVMTLDHDDYLDLVKALSYRAKKPERERALAMISGVVTAMLQSDTIALPPASEPLQFDLVVNAAELGALQFEAARAPDGNPLLARDDCTVTLTRRVRGAFAEQRMVWPPRPRVLFAWASPSGAGAEVPHAEHLEILRGALAPWIGPGNDDESKVLTVLGEVTLEQIEPTLREARDASRPFSHVHFLAHGYPIGGDHRKYFGMALHDENLELVVVEPDRLVEALAPLRGSAAMVTLATCESGSEANTLVAKKSIAHQLHVSGIPVVVASQYPLTMAGSSILMSEFYPAVLAGEDVRLALHRARVALYRSQESAHHDWVSMVCYACLPEGYAEVLLDMKLERTLASLKTAQSWADEIVKREPSDPDAFDRVESQLRSALAGLEHHVAQTSRSTRRGVVEENLGLLGSAEKRLSELCFHRARLDPGGGWNEKMRAALERSHALYLRAARRNLSHHWTGVQALCLQAVLSGSIPEPGLWHAAVLAASIERENEAEYWAQGSLAELHLLAPLAGMAVQLDEAAAMLEEMKLRLASLPGKDENRTFARESTRRQLQRYVQWWTGDHGFFPGRADLSADAARLLAGFG